MEEEVNLFLRQHKLMTVDRYFNSDGGGYWAIFITYQEGASCSTDFGIIIEVKSQGEEGA